LVQSQENKKELDALYQKYRPIEKTPTLNPEEKEEAMHDWWKSDLEIFAKEKISHASIKESINSGNLHLRNGFTELFEFCYEKDIGAVIVSAGFTQVIRYTIEHALQSEKSIGISQFFERFEICANSAVLNEEKQIISFKAPLIHCSNKREAISSISHPKTKKNLIVIGDIIEDIDMISNLDAECVLKIGFLNDTHIDKHLVEVYMDNFDIVIMNDGNLCQITNLLRKICGLENAESHDQCQVTNKMRILLNA